MDAPLVFPRLDSTAQFDDPFNAVHVLDAFSYISPRGLKLAMLASPKQRSKIRKKWKTHLKANQHHNTPHGLITDPQHPIPQPFINPSYRLPFKLEELR